MAIVFATSVQNKYNMGAYLGAEKAAKQAKIWFLIALGIMIIGFVISFILGFEGAFKNGWENY